MQEWILLSKVFVLEQITIEKQSHYQIVQN